MVQQARFGVLRALLLQRSHARGVALSPVLERLAGLGLPRTGAPGRPGLPAVDRS